MAATESAAPDAYREILIESGGDDIVLTSEVTGIPSNKLRLSLERSGFVGGGDHQKFDLARELDTIKAWKDVWARSEEHTSELQSLMRISYAVFCLKKKITPKRPRLPPIHKRITYNSE